jgi:adenylate cyclase
MPEAAAMPHVTKAMPHEARIAVPLLERALSLEPNCALAHGCLAWCYETLYLRDGLDPKIADAATTHAKAAMAQGRDDATAVAAAGFAFGMVGHDWTTASMRLRACSMALMFGSIVTGWANEPERAIEWGERGLRRSPVDPLSACGQTRSLPSQTRITGIGISRKCNLRRVRAAYASKADRAPCL